LALGLNKGGKYMVVPSVEKLDRLAIDVLSGIDKCHVIAYY